MGSVHRRAHSASSFRLALAIGSLLALASSLVPGLRGQTAPQTDGPGVEYAPDEILVRFKRDSTAPDRAQARAATGIRTFREFRSVERLQLLKLPTGTSVGDAIEYYARQPNVAYAEPNYRVRALVEPGDTRFGELWGLHSSTDVDIDAPEAWDLTTGSQAVVVGIIDTGIDYTHPDLVNNLFRNPLDCDADGVDDDGNGYVDDCFGIDAYNRDADPFDDNAHGTHVAGTIGASGDNGLGVVGVNWHVQLAACKFLGSSGSGSVSGAIECLDYFKALHDSGVAIVATSNSWGGGGYSQSLADAIAAHLDRGILFVAAAGNDSNDNDLAPAYPASYRLPNVISVAATTSADARASFSNFGQRSVHLAAPGAAILSTTPGNGYSSFSGTSMATPHVSGVAALLRAHQPSRDWRAIKNLLLAGGEAVAGGAGTITRRRLNAFGSLACSDATVFSRLEPMTSSIAVSSGSSVTLSALHIRCADPAGPVTVAIEPGGAVVTLHDDGVAPDTVSGDGLYAGAFTPGGPGPFTLTFPDGDTVTVVTVVGYAVEPTTYTYRTITGESLQLGDDSSAEIAAPFPIRLGGASFDRLFVNSNGNITFSGAYQAYVNQPLPALAAGIIVAPFWDDLTPASGTSQNVYWAVTGTAPNRELVVEWRDLPPYACRAEAASTVTFQVVFDEGSDRVLFNYADVIVGGGCSDNDRGGSATVGIQIASDYATEFSFGAQSLDDATALAWTVPGSCRLTLSSDSESFGAGGGTGLVNVTTVGTGCAWSATSQAAWIAISSGATGTGDGVVSYTVAPNVGATGRAGTMTIGSHTFSVSQAGIGCGFTLSPTALDIAAQGGAVAIDVSATADDCGWSASSPTDWITLGASGGTGSTTLGLAVAANGSSQARAATLSVAGQSVAVSQTGVACSFTVSPTTVSFGPEGGGQVVGIGVTATAADCAWTTVNPVEWVTLAAGGGSGSTVFGVTVKTNSSAHARGAALTVADQSVAVTQDGVACALTLSPTVATIGPAGGTQTVDVTAPASDCAWSVRSNAPWVVIDAGTSGSGEGTVRYTVAPNPAGAPRSSTLSIGGGQTIVTQAAASLTLDTVYPSAGDIYGGTKVTLVGSGFRLGTPVTVFLGGVPCTNVRVVDDTTVSCVAGPLARARPERGAITRAAVDVVVTAGSLTAVKSNGYTYVTASSDATSDTDADGMSDDWERRYSLDFLSASDQTADPDGDGKSNLQEYAEGGHPRGFHTRYFAEGAVGDFFDTRFALLNAQTEPARVLLRFIRPDGGHVSHDLLLDGMTRASVDPETLPALTEAEFSTVVESDVPVIADRQMSWDASGYGSHAETSVTAPATTWYLAEGATHSGFSLFYLLQNPGDSVSEVQVAYLRPAPAVPLSRTYTIPPRSRRNIWVNLEDPALADTDVSAVITSTNGVPIIVERAMYLDGRGQRFDAGHESAGVTAPGTEWYLAEGATGSYFDLFVLVANPHPTQATITATYLVPSGPPIVKTYTVGPRSRYSIWVDQEDPRLAETAVSTIVRSTNGVGVVVERSMWWPGSAASWHEAHNSAGVGRAGSRWALAEGEIGGPNAQETYVLIANTANAPGLVRVTLVFEDGTTSARTFALAPTSRLNIDVASLFPEAASRRFGAVVESLGPSPVPIVVERAMYTTTNGVTWIAGTNAPATRIE